MKKAISLILALVLCLSLCACGGSVVSSEKQPITQPKTMEEVLTERPWRSTFVLDGATCHKIIIFNNDGTCDFTIDFGGSVSDYTTTNYTIEDSYIVMGGSTKILYTFNNGTLKLNIALSSGETEELVQFDG